MHGLAADMTRYDFNVSIWLKDQISRSNLVNSFSMIEHSSTQYAKLMQRADVFLVTSRLDPLPNVAIDALISGTPVMCFDKACGLANLFKEDKNSENLCAIPGFR